MPIRPVTAGAVCLALFLVPTTNSFARDPDPSFALRVADGFRSLLRPDCVFVLAAGGGGAYLVHQSEDPSLSAELLDAWSVDGGLDVGEAYGDGRTIVGASALMMVAGRLGHPRLGAAGRDIMASLAVAATSTWAIKLAVNRRRPLGGPHSFPSGHTAAAFSTLPAIYRHTGPWVGLAATVLATGTGAGRMEDRRHYVSDVVFGAALGFASGMAVMGDDIPWAPVWKRLRFSGEQLRFSFDF